MPHVVLLRSLHPEVEARLRAEPGYTVETLLKPTPENLPKAMEKAEAVIVRATPINAEFLSFSPKLAIVARHGVGYDAVDVPELTKHGIPLTVTAEANAPSVAEHALTLILTIAKQIRTFDINTRAEKWSTVDAPTAYDVAGMNILVVGFGRIGTRVARLCAAFGMNVIVHDPFIPMNTVKGCGYRYAKTLHEGLAQADWVTMHCPAHAENRGMVNAEFIAAMKPGARFINTARGSLVNEEALAAGLKSGHVAAAGVDVYSTEPVPASNLLLNAPNLIATPHSAAGTQQGMYRMGMSAITSIFQHFKGELDEDMVINKEVLRGNR